MMTSHNAKEVAGWTAVLLIGAASVELRCSVAHDRLLFHGRRGWDYNTDTPKAPRSHYDHVSKKLVLNMDHCESM